MDTLQKIAAETALKKMLRQGHFSICTIDEIVKMTGSVPDGRAYQILRLMHCVDFKDMPPEIHEQMPELLRAVLSGTELDLAAVMRRPEPDKTLQVIQGGKAESGWLKRMIGHEF